MRVFYKVNIFKNLQYFCQSVYCEIPFTEYNSLEGREKKYYKIIKGGIYLWISDS